VLRVPAQYDLVPTWAESSCEIFTGSPRQREDTAPLLCAESPAQSSPNPTPRTEGVPHAPRDFRDRPQRGASFVPSSLRNVQRMLLHKIKPLTQLERAARIACPLFSATLSIPLDPIVAFRIFHAAGPAPCEEFHRPAAGSGRSQSRSTSKLPVRLSAFPSSIRPPALGRSEWCWSTAPVSLALVFHVIRGQLCPRSGGAAPAVLIPPLAAEEMHMRSVPCNQSGIARAPSPHRIIRSPTWNPLRP